MKCMSLPNGRVVDFSLVEEVATRSLMSTLSVCFTCQTIGGSAGLVQITGNQVAQGYSPSSCCSLFRAERIAVYEDCPRENSARKDFKNSCATTSGTGSRMTITWGICKSCSCCANPKPSQELKIAKRNPRLIAFLRAYFNWSRLIVSC